MRTVPLSTADTPVDEREFARLMSRFEPFESAPRLAVAVSGGADSVALALLADGWAGQRDGRIDALIVDHRLRPESTAEAAIAHRRLAARGLVGHVLDWIGPKPTGGVQAAARTQRYRLLRDWCRAAGVLHLLVGHHADDQAETVAMRLLHGSGTRGLAAMRGETATPECRILRPLLTVPAGRLKATLAAVGEVWLDDPSNGDPAFERVRLRALRPVLAAAGADRDSLCALAARARGIADALDAAVAEALASTVSVHPAGCAWIDDAGWRALPPEVARRVLSRLLATIGGCRYPPPGDAVIRLSRRIDELPQGSAATLARCRLVRHGGRVLVHREGRGLPAPVTVRLGRTLLWDRRFRLSATGPGAAAVHVAPLVAEARRAIIRDRADFADHPLPMATWSALPASIDRLGVREVPHLGYRRGDVDGELQAVFRPVLSLAGDGNVLA